MIHRYVTATDLVGAKIVHSAKHVERLKTLY